MPKYRLQMYLQTYFVFLPLKHFYNTNKKKKYNELMLQSFKPKT